jgi:hypothetical protein
MQYVKIGVTLGSLLVGLFEEAAHGDGGIIRLSRSLGGYRVSIFTAPTPFQAGPVDISVFVQDIITSKAVPEALVTVQLTPCRGSGRPMRRTATSEAATNKLFKAVDFELPEPGRWEIEVTIVGGQGMAQVRFELEATTRAPEWPAIWPWISWPALVIMLFSVHQLLVWRRSRQPV